MKFQCEFHQCLFAVVSFLGDNIAFLTDSIALLGQRCQLSQQVLVRRALTRQALFRVVQIEFQFIDGPSGLVSVRLTGRKVHS